MTAEKGHYLAQVEDVEVEGDPACEHVFAVVGVTPDDLLYGCKNCGRQVWGV